MTAFILVLGIAAPVFYGRLKEVLLLFFYKKNKILTPKIFKNVIDSITGSPRLTNNFYDRSLSHVSFVLLKAS